MHAIFRAHQVHDHPEPVLCLNQGALQHMADRARQTCRRLPVVEQRHHTQGIEHRQIIDEGACQAVHQIAIGLDAVALEPERRHSDHQTIRRGTTLLDIRHPDQRDQNKAGAETHGQLAGIHQFPGIPDAPAERRRRGDHHGAVGKHRHLQLVAALGHCLDVALPAHAVPHGGPQFGDGLVDGVIRGDRAPEPAQQLFAADDALGVLRQIDEHFHAAGRHLVLHIAKRDGAGPAGNGEGADLQCSVQCFIHCITAGAIWCGIRGHVPLFGSRCSNRGIDCAVSACFCSVVRVLTAGVCKISTSIARGEKSRRCPEDAGGRFRRIPGEDRERDGRKFICGEANTAPNPVTAALFSSLDGARRRGKASRSFCKQPHEWSKHYDYPCQPT